MHSCYVRMSESSVKGVSFGKVVLLDCAEDQPCPSSWSVQWAGRKMHADRPHVGLAGGKSSEKEPGDLVCCGGATSELDLSGLPLPLPEPQLCDSRMGGLNL